MAASRRGQPELQVRLPSNPNLATAVPDLPPISALFLINFDVKAGYTISWKAAKPGVELEGVVEYKSLPSGLHTVSEDLIYFVHDGFAGLSAFVNAPVQDTESRNARMLAVGVLVPLSYGRLGRAWKHAEGLKPIASALAKNGKDMSMLQVYWKKFQEQDEADKVEDSAIDTPSVGLQTPIVPVRGHVRNRSASDGAALLPPGHRLSPFHPAWSLTKLLDTFGPLIFPIQRAALLRKRILVSCHAPVQEACNFVYDISVLSNIPQPTFDILSPSSPTHRLRPLFSIGVHDIPFLVEDANAKRDGGEHSGSEQEAGTGWIACTTDSILAKKDTLWDMLITMPAPHSARAQQHAWPKLESPQGVPVKATQRDLRRFRSLQAGLARLQASPNASPVTPRTPRTATAQDTNDPFLNEAKEREVVEPLSWTALAYNGFMWWASAGEQARSEQAEESARDADLLADLSSSSAVRMEVPRSADLSTSIASLTPRHASATTATGLPSTGPLEPDEARVELAIIAYFHRLTTQLLTTLADVVESPGGGGSGDTEEDEDDDEGSDSEGRNALLPSDSGDDDDNEDLDGRGIRVRSEAVSHMGLDVWSASDARFVADVAAAYFGRRAYVEGKGVELCGVKVC